MSTKEKQLDQYGHEITHPKMSEEQQKKIVKHMQKYQYIMMDLLLLTQSYRRGML